MKAADVMTESVLTVRSDASIDAAIGSMLENHISGLPVVDADGAMVGIVTEGDFLRRTESDTEKHRPRWLEFVLGPGRLAQEFTRSHGRKVDEVMSRDVVSVGEETPVEVIVRLMEEHRIKRVPVVRGKKPVGIVTRANLLKLVIGHAHAASQTEALDGAIRDGMAKELAKLSWVPKATVESRVKEGVLELWGVIFDERQRAALRVAAENVPGVRAVRDHLIWIEPMSGAGFGPPEEGDDPNIPGRLEWSPIPPALGV